MSLLSYSYCITGILRSADTEFFLLETYYTRKVQLMNTVEESTFERAIRFALNAHHGMVRKGSGTPYITHPLEVAAIAGTVTSDGEILAAAVLHDVVEDTPYTIDDIRENFGDRVASLVSSDTEDKMESLPPEETWLARKTATIEHLKNAPRDEKIIILGDKLSNIRSCRQQQLVIGDKLWERFHEKRKEKHAWYYSSILHNLSEFKDEFAYIEYKRLVAEVFGEEYAE